jgi:Uncharacterized conserved protein (COG2071)/Domain of unknown function (DUF4259)
MAKAADGHSGRAAYTWRMAHRWHRLEVRTLGRPMLPDPASVAAFTSEHYWGYTVQRDGGSKECRVEHPPWRVWDAEGAQLAASCRRHGTSEMTDWAELSRQAVAGMQARNEEWLGRFSLQGVPYRRSPAGRPAPDLPEEGRTWVDAHRVTVPPELRGLSVQALDQVAAGSELQELWAESEESAVWIDRLQELRSRLVT